VFYVYVLYSTKDQGLYIGFTADLKRRIQEHRDGLSPSTANRRPLMLAYYEAYHAREDAEARERFLKSGSGRTFLKKQLRHFLVTHPLRTKVPIASTAWGVAFYAGHAPAWKRLGHPHRARVARPQGREYNANLHPRFEQAGVVGKESAGLGAGVAEGKVVQLGGTPYPASALGETSPTGERSSVAFTMTDADDPAGRPYHRAVDCDGNGNGAPLASGRSLAKGGGGRALPTTSDLWDPCNPWL